jgi:cytochrome c-type biogenesis protein CcsB
MNTAVTTIELDAGFLARRSLFDWLFALVVAAGGLYAFGRYAPSMDVYEKGILLAAMPAAAWLGWSWRPLRVLMLVVAGAALAGIACYQGELARAEHVGWLKYLLSSQSAILWMSVLFIMSTVFYWIGLLAGGQASTMQTIASRLAWAAVAMALVGTMMRWYESYLLGADIGHIPVSNLYEVFVLFCWMTTLFHLYFEQQYQARSIGAFVMLVVSAAVGFLTWYSVARQASDIQPLVPALKSWWMKLHVPANFIGYGTFSLAAAVACAYLVKQHATGSRFPRLAAIAARLPAPDVLDELMYRSIALGFAFFTIATVLGALWAAEAWGGYWSWDPKETWALIVWLNYAAWLHMRLMKGLRGTLSAWWALVGLVVTTFAFLGVNMFLSGLHSYGEL